MDTGKDRVKMVARPQSGGRVAVITPAAAPTGRDDTASLWKGEQTQMNMSPNSCGHQRPHQKLSRWPLSGGVCLLEESGRGI